MRVQIILRSKLLSLSIILGGLITPGASALADDPAYCQDLASFACETPGPFDEGIGRTELPGQAEPKAMVDKIKESAAVFFKQELHNDQTLSQWVHSKVSPDTSEEKLIDDLSDLAVGVIVPSSTFETALGKENYARYNALKELFAFESRTYLPNAIVHFKANLRDQLSDPDYGEKISEAATLVKQKYRHLIDFMHATNSVKMALKLKINRIQSCADCGEASEAKADLSSVFTENLLYDPQYNEFQAFRGMSAFSTSYFGVVFTVAHEMGHSISPCGIDAPYQTFMPREEIVDPFNYPLSGKETPARAQAIAIKYYPFSQSLQCLMSPQSIAATNSGLPTASMPSPFCLYGGSQADEAQADAFATDILVSVLTDKVKKENLKLTHEQYAKGFANIFRFTCGKDFKVGDDTHPSFEKRYNKILLAHPKVRELMGCHRPLKKVNFCGP